MIVPIKIEKFKFETVFYDTAEIRSRVVVPIPFSAYTYIQEGLRNIYDEGKIMCYFSKSQNEPLLLM